VKRPRIYEACFDGSSWRAMAAPNPTSALYLALRDPGDTYRDGLGNLYRVREPWTCQTPAAGGSG
jgi:hypothetical protein